VRKHWPHIYSSSSDSIINWHTFSYTWKDIRLFPSSTFVPRFSFCFATFRFIPLIKLASSFWNLSGIAAPHPRYKCISALLEDPYVDLLRYRSSSEVSSTENALDSLNSLSCSTVYLILFRRLLFFFFGIRLNNYSVNIADIRFSSLIGQDLLSCRFISLIATLIVLRIVFH